MPSLSRMARTAQGGWEHGRVAVRISLQGTIGFERVEVVCRKLAALARGSDSAQVQFDLENLEELCPAGLALLTATARRLHARGIPGVLDLWTPPRETVVEARLGLPAIEALLGTDAGGGIGVGMDPPGFGGCEPFSDVDGLVRATAALIMTLREQGCVPETTLGTVGMVLSELGGNVLRHADIGDGVAAACADPGRDRFELAVADCGVGISRSLARNPDYAQVAGDHRAAIRAAVQAGVTSDVGTRGGLGLYLSRLIVSQNGGEMVVRSGDARLIQRDQIDTTMGLTHHRGTLVTIRGRLDRPFDLELVNRLLEEPGGAAL